MRFTREEVAEDRLVNAKLLLYRLADATHFVAGNGFAPALAKTRHQYLNLIGFGQCQAEARLAEDRAWPVGVVNGQLAAGYCFEIGCHAAVEGRASSTLTCFSNRSVRVDGSTSATTVSPAMNCPLRSCSASGS